MNEINDENECSLPHIDISPADQFALWYFGNLVMICLIIHALWTLNR